MKEKLNDLKKYKLLIVLLAAAIIIVIAVIIIAMLFSNDSDLQSGENVLSEPIISSSTVTSITPSSSEILSSEETSSQEPSSQEPSSEPEDEEPQTDDPLLQKLYKARKKNSDAVGWLYIGNTKCDYAVMHSDDNQYYLDKDEEKNYSKRGALFADFRCSFGPDGLSRNTVVYGHSMKDGTMFTQLFVYKKLSFLNNNPIIEFAVDEDTESRWKIFACMITDINFDYINPSPSDSEFMDMVEECRERSLYNTNVDVNEDDKIITLSTCTYEYKDEDARFVVLARQLREGEEEYVDPAEKNPDIKEPEF